MRKLYTFVALAALAVATAGCLSTEVGEDGQFGLSVSPLASVARVQAGEDRQDEAIEGVGKAVAELAQRAGEQGVADDVDATLGENQDKKTIERQQDFTDSWLFWLLLGTVGGPATVLGGKKGIGALKQRLATSEINRRLADPTDPLTEAPPSA